MDVVLFAAFLFCSIISLLYFTGEQHRLVCACVFVVGIFFFFMSRSLEALAGIFLVNVVLTGFGFKETFSVVDYKSETSSWKSAGEFLKRNRLNIFGLFALFNVIFFLSFSMVKERLILPVEKPQVLSFELGQFLISSHWVGILILFITVAILVNVNGKVKR